jgi:radical SAM superfamily enzyme YgiQ (UPF0313 family)
MKTDVLLFSINAGYVHPAMGLWYLRANLGDAFVPEAGSNPARGAIHGHTVDVLELTRRAGRPRIIAEVLQRRPRILAAGLYIWNHLDMAPVLRAVRQQLPETLIVLGGPEATHLAHDHPTLRLVDGVVTGEAERIFGTLLLELLADPLRREGKRPPDGGRFSPSGHWVVAAPPPDLATVHLPHPLFSDRDVQHRFMYLEASRGCPFRCQFCLSSLDRYIRTAPLEQLFETAESLLQRGARRFKFIDRTFNLDFERAAAVLEFWLDRMTPGLSVQFETVPDRFPAELRALIRRFPAGSLRLEVGMQTFNGIVAKGIERHNDIAESERTLSFLSRETNAVTHVDLIVGLPGETMESFAAGFNLLFSFAPQEIQVGILKRLPGAPIAVHDAVMRYRSEPPYDVLESDALSATDVERLKRFAKYWELVVNRGRFPELVRELLAPTASAFQRFLAFSDFAWQRFGRTFALTPEELQAAMEEFVATAPPALPTR